MPFARIKLAALFVISMPVVAEPYAEWGGFADGKSLSEFGTGVKVPDSEEVPIPLAPGGVFVSASGNSNCTMHIITDRSVTEVCDFYKSKLTPPEYEGYETVEELLLEEGESCAIFEDGISKQGIGVWVYKKESRLYAKNGTTLVAVNYHAASDEECGN